MLPTLKTSEKTEALAKKIATKYPTLPGSLLTESNSGFSWAKYMAETGGTAAPLNCFNQVLKLI